MISGLRRSRPGHLARRDDAADDADGRRDPARPGRRGTRHRSPAATGGAQTANTGRGFIVLKPRDERELTSSQIIDRLRPQLAKIQGANMYLQPTQDITVGGRIARASFQYTLQDSNLAELSEWSGKMLDKMRTLPQITDVASDLLANAPQLKITINRDQASRFGISPQLIDDTLNDAFGQRQITQYFTQLKTYFVVLEILPELQKDLSTLNRLYVKSPLTGGAVPLSSLVDVDIEQGRPAVGGAPGPVPGGDADVQPAAGRGARRGRRRHRRSRARNPDAVLDHPDLPGQRAGVPELAVQRADPDRRGADRRLHHPRHALRELHPSADHPVDAAVGRRRRAARAESRQHGPVGDRHHRHHPADRHRQEERHHAGGLRHQRRARPPSRAAWTRSARPACCASGRS